MRLGDIQQCCELLVKINDWQSALSIAPAVSLEYWRGLTGRAARWMMSENKNNHDLASVEPYFIASHNLPQLVAMLVDGNRMEEAMLLCKVEEDGGFDSAKALYLNVSGYEKRAEEQETQSNGSASLGTDIMMEGATDSLRDVVRLRGESLLKAGQPVLAACCHLSINDIHV